MLLGFEGDSSERVSCVHRRGHGKISFFDLSATVAANWKKVPAEERKPYEELARKDKLRFQKEMQEYEATSLYLAESNLEESVAVSVTSSAASTPPRDEEDDDEEHDEIDQYCAFVEPDTLVDSPFPFPIESSFTPPESGVQCSWTNNKYKSFSFQGSQAGAPDLVPSDAGFTGALRLTGPSSGRCPGPVPLQAPLSLPTSTKMYQSAQANVLATMGSHGSFAVPSFHTTDINYATSFQPVMNNGPEDFEPTPFAPLENGTTLMPQQRSLPDFGVASQAL